MRGLILATVILASCGAVETARSTPTPSAAPTSSATPTSSTLPSLDVKLTRLTAVPSGAIASPDGKWIAAREPSPTTKTSYVPAALIYDLDGKLVRRIEAPGGAWRWTSDSSGLFIALNAPQRAPDLGIVDIATGTLSDTGLQMTGMELSRDGSWIVANNQEGCCMAVVQREIWMAPRTGGTPQTIAMSETPAPQSIGVIGIDAKDRLVYHDGDRILRLLLTGGTPELIGTLPSGNILATEKTYTNGDTSPDGTAMFVRTYDPLGWYVIANDRVVEWDEAHGSIVEDRQGMELRFYATPIWTGPHTIVVTSASGALATVDLLSGTSTPLAGTIRSDDRALAFANGRLLVARGRTAVVIATTSGQIAETGLDLGTDTAGTLASVLADGRFILSTVSGTYRID